MTQPLIFISYSRRDEEAKNALLSQLDVLQSVGLIEVWSDDRIKAGGDWKEEIYNYMDRAHVAIFLITSHFLSSKFVKEIEVPRLLKRHQSGELNIFPIIAKPCPWQFVPWLAELNVLPRNGIPIWKSGNDVETVLVGIVEEVAETISPGLDVPHKFDIPSPPPRLGNRQQSKNAKAGKSFIPKKLKWSVLALAIVIFSLWAFTFSITIQKFSETRMFPPLSVLVYSPKYISPNENESIVFGVHNGQNSDISAKLRLIGDNSQPCFIKGERTNTILEGQINSLSQINQNLTVLYPWDMSQTGKLGRIAGLSLWGEIGNGSATKQELPIRIAPLPWIRSLKYYSGLSMFPFVAFFVYVVIDKIRQK
jgi:hypothetical protein